MDAHDVASPVSRARDNSRDALIVEDRLASGSAEEGDCPTRACIVRGAIKRTRLRTVARHHHPGEVISSCVIKRFLRRDRPRTIAVGAGEFQTSITLRSTADYSRNVRIEQVS